MFDFPDDTMPEGVVLTDRAQQVYDSTLSNHKHLDEDKHHNELVVYSTAVDRHERACEEVSTLESLSTIGAKGGLVMHPAVRVARDEATVIRQMAAALQILPQEVVTPKEAVDENPIATFAAKRNQLSA